MTLSDAEIVTPEGRFASIRTPTVIDAFAAGMYEKDPNWSDVVFRLCVLCVKVDGETVTKESLGHMPMYEFRPISERLTQLMTAPPAKG